MNADCSNKLSSLTAGAILVAATFYAVSPSAQVRSPNGVASAAPAAGMANENPTVSGPRSDLARLHAEIGLVGHLMANGQSSR